MENSNVSCMHSRHQPRAAAAAAFSAWAACTLLLSGLLSGCSGGEETSLTTSGDAAIEQVAVEDRAQVGDFTATLLNGERLDTESLAGSVVVYNVWGSWCGPCRKEAPDLRAVARSYQPQGVAFYGLNVRDDEASARSFERQYEVPYSSVVPSESGQVMLEFNGQLTLTAVPTTVVVDSNGRVAARVMGAVTAATLRALLDDVLAETPVDPAESSEAGSVGSAQ